MEAYQKINFEDSPSSTTPLNAANLNHMDDGIAAVNEAVTGLEGGKLDDSDGSVKENNIADESITVEKVANDLAAVINAKEVKSNKKTTLTGSEASNDYYPTTKAVADALSTKAPASTAYTFDSTTANVTYNAANPKIIYTNAYVNGKNAFVLTTANNYYQIALCYDGTEYKRELTAGGAVTYTAWAVVNNESSSNKQSSITAVNKASTTLYPSIKAVVDYLAANYENLSNKLTSIYGIDSDSTDTEYPSAKAVYDFGADILNDVNEEISDTNADIADLKAYIGYTDGDILGLQADFENNVFTRLGAAAGKTAGSDFNAFPMYGQRRRVVVDSNGVIDDSYSPEDVEESDTNVDVMVYQPKFYYKVVPLKLEKQTSGIGYHIRKANYYISSTPHAGFKLHPLFYDANGNEVDYVLFSAYEASYMYWRAISPTAGTYEIFHDGVDTVTTTETSAVLKSLPGVKPISGKYKVMNKVNMENCALRKSPNWHLDTIQSVSANQLLMMIEAGTFNIQAALGRGVVNHINDGSNNGSSLTGATSAAEFNTASGMANQTISDVNGTESVETTNGKLSVSYRGIENPWGNINKILNGVRIIGDGQMNGGQPYISNDFSMNSQNYKPVGFTMSNSSGYISAFGYSDSEHDWLFIPSENNGNSVLPAGDYCYVSADLNGERIVRFGGTWFSADNGGLFNINVLSDVSARNYLNGCRLLFVPTAAD